MKMSDQLYDNPVMNKNISEISMNTTNNCNEVPAHHILFQMANICFVLSYTLPNSKYCILIMHSVLALASLLMSVWAWNLICGSGVMTWNMTFMFINLIQTFYLLYTMRQIKFSKELEEIYQSLFEPVMISRTIFKKLAAIGQIMILHAGEAYAMESLTKTDRLGLLISGKVNVISGNHFLHCIESKQFLDSPEFESSKLGSDDKFKVSLIAATSCRYIFWQRESLEFLLFKQQYLANILSLILSRDITNKLYAMNEKIVADKGSQLDIRLPIIITSLCNSVSSVDQQNESPITSRTPLREKDQIVSPTAVYKGARSRSLQTNSLGLAVSPSPRVTTRASALKLSPKKDFIELKDIITEETDIDNNNKNTSTAQGVKFKSYNS
ncbi:popeye domain-containing protein 3-like [Oppia nitens]|uniref:popeye domain-containing protein 3-like n=1 Tax=Oppia nitens TaxID=1686743 RepID=UPI0023DAD967|nr:popeye domain-containing protein 3-like [Oppia nitens]